jgi:DMSO reductase family type II enzyme chaperone
MPATNPTSVALETAPRRRHSVFGNYTPERDRGETIPAVGLPTGAPGNNPYGDAVAGDADLALARSFVHQFLARAFDYPASEIWGWLSAASTQETLAATVSRLQPDPAAPLREAQACLARCLVPQAFEAFHDDYIAAIGHAARGSCPINEIEYGDLKADPLFQPHRLADLAAFYRAFGLEVSEISDERQDHLSVELEYMGVLTAQEANHLGAAGGSDALLVCRQAQQSFLREHLGRWAPAFARRLHRAVGDTPLGSLARFALAFVESECLRCGVRPGSEDLLLRPADEAASSCDGCGLAERLPGSIRSDDAS